VVLFGDFLNFGIGAVGGHILYGMGMEFMGLLSSNAVIVAYYWSLQVL
jgi:hypothetical protein